MNFGFPADMEEFRSSVRSFAASVQGAELDEEIALGEAGVVKGPVTDRIRSELDRRGWMKMCWPTEFGGEGRSAWYQYILNEEMGKAHVPIPRVTGGVDHAVMRFGTEQQKAKYLPGMWNGDIIIALGYSEPNAGTDLAALQTQAQRIGDEWVINGQKLWTTHSHVATHVWLAARTDPDAPKHRGISMFIVPLNSPGITVRPIWTMSGERTNETFYEHVHVGTDALIGEENKGWYIAANALDYERVQLGSAIDLVECFEGMVEHLEKVRPAVLARPSVRLQLAEMKLDLHVHRALKLLNADLVARGETPTMVASMVKIWSSELRYRMSSAQLDILGRSGLLTKESGEEAVNEGTAEQTYRFSPVFRFGGGTNEVQRDIIAQRGLGLPRG